MNSRPFYSKKMNTKMFTKKFETHGMANTLSPEYIGTNDSGWTIEGRVVEDYFTWVNDFKATHPTYGKVSGNFEFKVTATSEEAYNHFVENHPPNKWDYQDI